MLGRRTGTGGVDIDPGEWFGARLLSNGAAGAQGFVWRRIH